MVANRQNYLPHILFARFPPKDLFLCQTMKTELASLSLSQESFKKTGIKSSKTSLKTSLPMPFGGRWTTGKCTSESTVTRPVKVPNNGPFEMIRIKVTSLYAFVTDHTSYHILRLFTLSVSSIASLPNILGMVSRD
jgi:hypothetical protein